jgi:transcriptional regulator with XRE-family HTH domain
VEILRMPTPRFRFGLRADELAARIARELTSARALAGRTQGEVAREARVSQSFVSQVERGHKLPTVRVMHRLASAVGHDLSIRFYPAGGIRLRDSGQMQMAEAIRAALDPAWRIRLEVPVGPPPDPRAADMVLEAPAEVLQIEIERSLADFQAQVRAAQLKRTTLAERMGRPVRLVIALPDTRRNRALIADHRLVVRATLPESSRRIWACLRSATEIGGDGLLWVQDRGPRASR